MKKLKCDSMINFLNVVQKFQNLSFTKLEKAFV